MKILEKFTEDFNHKDYIESWKNCTITSDQWYNSRYINHWEELDKMTLSEDQEVLIIRHQRKLFNKLVKIQVDKTVLHIENKDKASRKRTIDYQTKLIDSFINNCESKHNNKFLADVFGLTPFREPLLLYNAYHNIVNSYPSPIRKRYSLTEPSKPGYSCWFIAEMIYQYQLVITQLLSNTEEKLYMEPAETTIANPEKMTSTKTENLDNDFTKSTIEDYLEPIKENFTEESYIILVDELQYFFTTGNFSNKKMQIKTKGRTNKKRIGWHLNELYRCFKKSKLSIDYLLYARDHIDIYKDIKIDLNNPYKSNLYKYFTEKTPKK